MMTMKVNIDKATKYAVFTDEDGSKYYLIPNYDFLQFRINNNDNKTLKQEKEDLEKQIEALNDVITAKNAEIEKAKSDYNALCSELKTQKDLNVRTLEISRERSNAERGLVPKKDHPGYVLKKMEEYTESINDYPVWDVITKINVWRYSIQTPFSCRIPSATVSGNVVKDIQTGSWNGINHFVDPEHNGDPKAVHDDERKVFIPDVVYRWKFHANTVTGLWEVELYTVNEIKWSDEVYPCGLKKAPK